MGRIIAFILSLCVSYILVNYNNDFVFPEFTQEQMEQICIEEGLY